MDRTVIAWLCRFSAEPVPVSLRAPYRPATPNWVNSVSAAPAEHAVTSPKPPVRALPDLEHRSRGRHWPRSLAALQVRDYRLYLTSQIVATTGLWMQRIAQDWLVLELTGSVTVVGMAVAF